VSRAVRHGWREANPLRAWRRARGYSQVRAAGCLDVSRRCVQLWEAGLRLPWDDNFEGIKHLTGNADIRSCWRAWLERKENEDGEHLHAREGRPQGD
jgi:hypothetical protein